MSSAAPSKPRPPTDDFSILDSEPGAFLFGAWKNVLIIVWRRHATGPAVERFAKAIEVMASRKSGLRSNIHIIEPGAGLPTADARAGFVRLMQANRSALACVAIVIGGTAFWASALRSAMTGLRVLSPRSFDFRVFGSPDDVVRWLPAVHRKKTGVPLESGDLRAVLELAVAKDT